MRGKLAKKFTGKVRRLSVALQKFATQPGLRKPKFVPDHVRGTAHGRSDLLGRQPSEIPHFNYFGELRMFGPLGSDRNNTISALRFPQVRRRISFV